MIAAMSEDNRVIGKNGQLPWDISEDLNYFREVTAGKTVVMGYKTFLSIGRLLPDRENIILSKSINNIDGAKVFSSKQEVLEYLEKYKGEEIFIIGGEQIYRLFLDNADKIYLNIIHKNYSGDTFFPKFEDNFVEIKREEGKEFDKIIYERK